jgi:hypothetical protein
MRRIKRRSAVILGLAAAGVLALAGIALATTSTVSFQAACGSSTVPPFNNKCPKSTFKGGSLNVHTHTDYTTGSFVGAKTDRARLYFDNDFKVDATVVGKCDPANLTGKNMKQAMTACGSKLVGTGTATATAATPQDVHACVLAFNGKNDTGGNPTLLLFTRAQVTGTIDCSNRANNTNGNSTVVLSGSLKPANLSGYGKLLDFNHINAASPFPLNDFNVTVGKGKVAGAGNYISAKCSASPWKLKTTFNYTDSSGTPTSSQTLNSTHSCTVG